MRNFTRIATGVNVTPLLLAISRRPELWKEDTYLRDYPQGPFGEIDSIMLRFPEKRVFEQEAEVEAYKRGEHFYDQHESVPYPALKELPEAQHLIQQVFAATGGVRLGRVMINRIAPRGRIFPHADTPEHTKYYSRYHLVLQSAPGVRFSCGDENAYWEPGALFWFRNSEIHEVVNSSTMDRIHMVLDAHHDGVTA